MGPDCSNGMLAHARRRVQHRRWHNLSLVQGDAVTLEGVPGPFDAVVSVWSYGIVYDLEAALNGAVDVLRPGGRIAILDFERARPERGLLRPLYPVYARVLQRAGIDSAEDVDDAQLRARWSNGRRLLHARLSQLHVEHYLNDAGLIVAGTVPPDSAGT